MKLNLIFRHCQSILLCTLILLVGCSFSVHSLAQSFRKYVVSQQHPNASDKNPGTSSLPFSTISQAAALAQPGDTVLVRAGIYRERVAPPRGGEPGKPIVYLAATGEEVYIKGSEVWQPEWQETAVKGILFGTFPKDAFSIPTPENHGFDNFPTEFNPYQYALRKAPGGLDLSLGQLFVDGKPLIPVDNKDDLKQVSGSWMVNEEKTGLYVHFPFSYKPLDQTLIELTTRSRVFAPYRRGLGYIHIKGFIMEHGATNFPAGFWSVHGSPQAGILGCRGGHHWVIENNTIRYGKTVGLDIGSEGPVDADSLGQPQPEGTGYHIIRNNIITDNGSAGIVGIRSTGTSIVGNRFERNNRLGFSAPEMGGVKLHFFIDGEIRQNLFRGNYCYGLWLDNVYRNSRVTRNVIIGNQGTGIFIELGEGPLLVDNNVIALTYNTGPLTGDGIYSHDASGVTLAHNLIMLNANFGVWAHAATERKTHSLQEGKPVRNLAGASNWKIINNIIISNHVGALCLPAESERSRNNLSDYNVITASYNRLTVDTYSKELDTPIFMVNTNKGRVSIGQVAGELAEKLAQNLPEAEAPFHQERWEALPFLQWKEWQSLTGYDQHSVVPKVLRPTMIESNLQLNFIIDKAPAGMACPKVQGIENDFFGNPFPEQPLPGPFQNLKMIEIEPDASKKDEQGGPYKHIKSNKENLNVFWLWPKSRTR